MKTAIDNRVPELTIVVPTYNERENIEPLIENLIKALEGIQWELLLVDDNSPDHTADTINQFAQHDRRVRCIKRLNRRGLSSACIEGFLASSSPFVLVMDADLQHDETIIPKMLSAVKSNHYDLAVGSRYTDKAHDKALSPWRSMVSRFAIHLSRFLNIQDITDPVSGFFLFRRDRFAQTIPKLYGQGYKILIDMLSSSTTPVNVIEIPYAMRPRSAGDSKLELLIVAQYLLMLFIKLSGNRIPVTFLLFLVVGMSGVGVHLAVLTSLKAAGVTHFITAQSIATLIAMTTNFLLNNTITYRDQRLQGRHLLFGLFSFYVVCSIGALINISFANMLEQLGFSWIFCGTTGAAVGAIWNFTMTSVFTWTHEKQDSSQNKLIK